MTGRSINSVLSVDEIIAKLGRRRKGSIVTIGKCDPPEESFLIARRGKKEVVVFILFLSKLKKKLRQMGYQVITTPAAKRAVRRWDRGNRKFHIEAARTARENAEQFKKLETAHYLPWYLRPIGCQPSA